MVSSEAWWGRKRRQEELRGRRRIVSSRTAASARTHRAASAGSNARSCSSAAAGPGSGCPCVSGTHPRRGRARARLRSRSRRLRRSWRWNHNWLGRLDRFWWYYCGGCVRDRLELHVLQTLPARIATTSASSTARRAGTARTKGVLALEIVRRERIQNQQDDERMHKKRGGDTLPPPLPLAPARYADWRPIALFYCVASLGDTPMTFTPAPRATSIA